MKVSLEFATRQLSRLSALKRFPQDEEPYEDLVTALMNAPNENAVKLFVDRWIRENRIAPVPADIYAELGRCETVDYWQPPPRETRCKLCGDTGFEIVERGGLTGARECRCRQRKLRVA